MCRALSHVFSVAAFLTAASGSGAAAERPNILWITSEDNGPHLGAYGDAFADTPHLDALAARGLIYLYAWSNAPVCAPARTAIISGLHPPATGAEHMRSMTRLPQGMLMYPQYLREAGYYTTNNVKEDYNLEKPGKVWDDSSRRAHWRNRPAGRPFFSIFNITVTHESQIRKRPHRWVHDPSKVRVPAYHPDTIEVRRDWAQYYDQMTEMDRRAGEILAQLRADGLEDDTIVFYYADHGPGMPRSKRWPYDSGLHVPLIVAIPEKFRSLAPPEYKPGGKSTRLVSFVDLAPTVLSLAGIRPPSHFHGRAFLGKYIAPAPEYLFGYRGRMDERYDMVRSVRDRRFVYIRNYMPYKIYGQYLAYMWKTPTTVVWERLFKEGKLRPEQAAFWKPKPPEELYDLENDPDEIHNLAASPEHRDVLERMRGVLRRWILDVRDVGFLPEAEIHARSEGSTPYEMGHDPKRYPLERILEAAEKASSLAPGVLPDLVRYAGDPDSAVRYWGVLGILMRGGDAVSEAAGALRRALKDPAPSVRVAAAEALGRYGTEKDLKDALSVLIEHADMTRYGVYVAIHALNVIDDLDEKARPLLDALKRLPRRAPGIHPRLRNYVPRLLEKTLSDLEAGAPARG